MSFRLSATDIQRFDDELKNAYREERSLLVEALRAGGCRRIRENVEGKRIDFPKMGKAFMQKKTGHANELVPENIGYTRPGFDLNDYTIFEYSDIFFQQKTDVNEVREVAVHFAGCINQQKDQVIIDALENGSYTSTTPIIGNNGLLIDDGGTPAAMAVNKLKKAKAYFNSKGIKAGVNRLFFTDADSYEQLEQDPEFINMDYTNSNILDTGETRNRYMGFTVVLMPDDYQEDGANGIKKIGMPLNGTVRKNYALDVQSMGAAFGSLGKDSVNIEWHQERTAHGILGMLVMGAGIIDNQGVVEIQNDIA